MTWSTASCSAFDRIDCAQLSQKVVQRLSLQFSIASCLMSRRAETVYISTGFDQHFIVKTQHLFIALYYYYAQTKARYALATMSKQRSTLSKGRNFNAKLVRHCCWCGPGLTRRSEHCSVTQWRHQVVTLPNCIFFPISSDTKIVKINLKMWELLSEITLHVFMDQGVYTSAVYTAMIRRSVCVSLSSWTMSKNLYNVLCNCIRVSATLAIIQ